MSERWVPQDGQHRLPGNRRERRAAARQQRTVIRSDRATDLHKLARLMDTAKPRTIEEVMALIEECMIED